MKLGRVHVGFSVSLLAAAMVAAGCSGGDTESATPTTAAPASTTTTAPATYPLSGRPVSDAASLGRPALAVKIDNIAAARPQAGLEAADVIYEELAEGGLTRFVAVFHSTDAATLGPVRSVRPSDPDIVAPLDPLFAYSGGAPAVVSLLAGSRLTNVGFDAASGAYQRRSDRRSPQNLYTTTANLYGLPAASRAPGPPPALATFAKPGSPFTASGAVPVTGLALEAGPTVRAGYQYDAASTTWKRSTDAAPHLLEGGSQIAPTNVIVQYTPYTPFPADSKVSVAGAVGSGEAWIFSGGMAVKGTWTKAAPASVTTFTDGSGAPVSLLAGQTLIHLVSPGAATTIT